MCLEQRRWLGYIESWLQTNGFNLLSTVRTSCHGGVIQLEIRYFLPSQSAEEQKGQGLCKFSLKVLGQTVRICIYHPGMSMWYWLCGEEGHMERICPMRLPAKRTLRPLQQMAAPVVTVSIDSAAQRLTDSEWPRPQAASKKPEIHITEEQKKLMKHVEEFYGNYLYPFFTKWDPLSNHYPAEFELKNEDQSDITVYNCSIAQSSSSLRIGQGPAKMTRR